MRQLGCGQIALQHRVPPLLCHHTPDEQESLACVGGTAGVEHGSIGHSLFRHGGSSNKEEATDQGQAGGREWETETVLVSSRSDVKKGLGVSQASSRSWERARPWEGHPSAHMPKAGPDVYSVIHAQLSGWVRNWKDKDD